MNRAAFDHLAPSWWDANGPTRLLHAMNRTRVTFMRQQLGLRKNEPQPLKGLRILDVGCGAGILTESLARLGANTTGIDVSRPCIDTAMRHAFQPKSNSSFEKGALLSYFNKSIDDLLNQDPPMPPFDVICAMEVIEHVNDPTCFLNKISSIALIKPGGSIFISTINRTPLSFLLTIIGAEHILGIVPVGTHNWTNYIKPREITALLLKQGFELRSIKGMELKISPMLSEWSLTPNIDCNYIIHFHAPSESQSGGQMY